MKKDIDLPSESECVKYTRYSHRSGNLSGYIFYIHGGGLLYGNKNDLPDMHIEEFTNAGYEIIALDYPLCPEVYVDTIVNSLYNSILRISESELKSEIPVFLFGRSAGAYLSLLLAATHQDLKIRGIISWYGYGFFEGEWFKIPNEYYLRFPKVEEFVKSEKILCTKDMDKYYGNYIFARQNGQWLNLISNIGEEAFIKEYGLLDKTITAPVFACHSISDPDVPFSEYLKIKSKFNTTSLMINSNEHDFDRNVSSKNTEKAIKATLKFLDDLK